MNKKLGRALVVGAGISGIRAALDLAETGYGVFLIDRSPHLGGILSQLDYQFPTDHCGMCKMLPLMDRDSASQYCLRKGLFHENIEILLSTELLSVDGEAGNFDVMLKQKPNWVDPDLCLGCGKCADVCPVDVPDIFNAGVGNRKAIYLPVPHAIPNPFIIDFAACTRCGECEKICPTGAIRLSEQERQKFKILIVDDEYIVRDSLKEWLEEAGFSADTAESGEGALDRLSEKTYHLMLTDIKMPGMDGVELLKQAKETCPELTVVMMTAYATVETAVEAMKIGALDYLIKPFDPDKLIPMILKIYEDSEATKGRQLNVGAIVLCGGTNYFDPGDGKNLFGYGKNPNVFTSIEFERIISSTGPTQGRLIRPSDGKPVRKIAWIQCVGSRDLQTNADFCSSICCMHSIKEAELAKKMVKDDLETTIFYMDMRTFGKSFQDYRDQAEHIHGIRFERGRVHSVSHDDEDGGCIIRYSDKSGALIEVPQDMVILAVGQRPAKSITELAEQLGVKLNQWGFCDNEPFSLCQTAKEGILLGGAFSGLKDIGDSVLQASAAALSASRIIHSSGGSLIPEPAQTAEIVDVSREMPRILIIICPCTPSFSKDLNFQRINEHFSSDPSVHRIEFAEQICTANGWESLTELIKRYTPNRILIGACLPYVYAKKIRELSLAVGLNRSLIDVVDIKAHSFSFEKPKKRELNAAVIRALEMGTAKLKYIDPSPGDSIRVNQQALVVGGGITGITAALAIADHGYPVDLVEQSALLGGNLLWLKETLEGNNLKKLLDETVKMVEKHPLIHIHTETQVIGTAGDVGGFITTIEDSEGTVNSLEHGVTLIATGGKAHTPSGYGYGTCEAIITQKEMETQLSNGTFDPKCFNTVVMIQCADTREASRNYCSRVCCNSALKHAFSIKRQNPNCAIFILYRDMMSYGFTETYYTRAREADICFIQYDLNNKPTVIPSDTTAQVTVFESILGKNIRIDADLVVLATGIVPNLPTDLANSFGCETDPYGFFKEAESKWRPVDSLKEGIFACGLAHSPRSTTESIATAEAAAQRALRVLSRRAIPSSKITAKVHDSLCSLCERCIDACPYGARSLDIEEERVLANPVMCQGCGSCAAVCPNNASFLDGYSTQQVFNVIDAAMY